MTIQRYLPAYTLTSFVKAFLIIESDAEQVNRLVPDTSIVMAFRYKGTVSDASNGQLKSLPISTITGLRKSPRSLVYAPHTATLLVVFREGGAAAFFREPLHELFSQSLPLDDLIHQRVLTDLEEQLAAALHNQQRISLVEQFLLARLGKTTPEQLVDYAIGRIKAANGNANMKALAESLWISQDAFEKRFRRAVGTTPKQFAALVRFRHLINAQLLGQSLTELAYESGYFDQAHFIKDFRSFTGQAPHDFFKSTQYW